MCLLITIQTSTIDSVWPLGSDLFIGHATRRQIVRGCIVLQNIFAKEFQKYLYVRDEEALRREAYIQIFLKRRGKIFCSTILTRHDCRREAAQMPYTTLGRFILRVLTYFDLRSKLYY